MSNKISLNSPYSWSISFVLLWSILYFIFGEKISLGNGCGYDGVFYCTITQNFDTFILNTSLSSYYANRILPCAIVYVVLKVFGFSLTLPNIITAFYVLNTISWLTAMIFWHKILNRYQVSKNVQWLMNIFILLNFYFLKLIFYYPVLTDSMAFLAGVLLLWFYIQDKVLHLIVTGFLGAFVYPFFILYVCFLIIFSVHFKLKRPEKQTKTLIDYIIIAFFMILFASLRTYLAYHINYEYTTGFHVNTFLYVAVYSYVLYYIFPSYALLSTNLKPMLTYMTQKRTIFRLSISITIFLITTTIKIYLSQKPILKNPETMYMLKSILGIGFHGILWIVQYFSSFGLVAVFFIVLLRELYSTSITQSVGIYGMVLCFCLLNLQKETRVTADIYVFILLAIALSIETQINSIKRHFILYALINLLLSKVYLPIEKSSLIWNIAENTWVYKYYALSTYLMSGIQLATMAVLFLITLALVFRQVKT